MEERSHHFISGQTVYRNSCTDKLLCFKISNGMWYFSSSARKIQIPITFLLQGRQEGGISAIGAWKRFWLERRWTRFSKKKKKDPNDLHTKVSLEVSKTLISKSLVKIFSDDSYKSFNIYPKQVLTYHSEADLGLQQVLVTPRDISKASPTRDSKLLACPYVWNLQFASCICLFRIIKGMPPWTHYCEVTRVRIYSRTDALL